MTNLSNKLFCTWTSKKFFVIADFEKNFLGHGMEVTKLKGEESFTQKQCMKKVLCKTDLGAKAGTESGKYVPKNMNTN